SRPSHLLYIRRSATLSLGAGSGRSTVTKPRQGDAQPKGSRRASSCEGICLEDSPEKGWKPEDDVELEPLDPDQPDKEA
ncbi:unnamed protein product, partial [Prunus brigantina]